MPKLFAFLRAINVGGHTVTMADLRAHFAGIGFRDVETFIASGNVIFTARAGQIAAHERKIEAHLKKSLGYDVATFIRTAPELIALAGYRAFPETTIRSAGAYCVGFLGRPLDAAAERSLGTLATEIDEFHVHGREVYWLCRKRQHESKFSNVRFEKTTGAKITFRNANTVARLAALAGGTP
jgi:uncharacterized protein (DUF1697 family)